MENSLLGTEKRAPVCKLTRVSLVPLGRIAPALFVMADRGAGVEPSGPVQDDPHPDQPVGGQHALVAEGQAAEQKRQQQGDGIGHPEIAGMSLLADVSGNHQQAENQADADPGIQAELLAEQGRQAAE